MQIAVINESTAVTDDEIKGYLPAFDEQWNSDLKPVWGLENAKFSFVPKGSPPEPGSWWVVFLDDSDQATALAYHDLTDEGQPIAKVFVKSIKADSSSLSVGATHEICEMAVDPWLNSAYQDQQGTFWAGEVCDPVEDDQYAYKIDGVLVTDFVTPSWFAHKYAGGDFDKGRQVKSIYEILAGGYAQKFDP